MSVTVNSGEAPQGLKETGKKIPYEYNSYVYNPLIERTVNL